MKKSERPTDEIITDLRLQVARYDGAMARLCGILGCVPQDQTPDTRLTAVAAWMAAKDAEAAKPDWRF